MSQAWSSFSPVGIANPLPVAGLLPASALAFPLVRQLPAASRFKYPANPQVVSDGSFRCRRQAPAKAQRT